MRCFAACCALASVAACAKSPNGGGRASHSPEPSAHLVKATILANECGALERTEARRAEHTMYELVEGCTSVPGGSARFVATLVPGGAIRIDSEAGQPGVVPICVLKHPLVHHVRLDRPCRLDVSIAQSTEPLK